MALLGGRLSVSGGPAQDTTRHATDWVSVKMIDATYQVAARIWNKNDNAGNS